jgi:DprA/Smf-like nucleotide binding protein involved in DNA uptake
MRPAPHPFARAATFMTDFAEAGSGTPAGHPEVVGGTGQHHPPTGENPRQPYDQLDTESAQIMRAVPDRGSVTPEQLAVRTGLPLRIVLRRLPLLELADLVHRHDGGVALAKGDSQVDAALADLVSAYCAANPDQPLKPYEIARGITAATGRHLGTAAVLNCCLLLASTGRLVQVADAPIAFAFPAADKDGIPQS